MYGQGDHKAVLYLGLAGNIPRIALYFVLPALMGINGTAIAWLVGSFVQMVVSIYYGKSHNILRLEYKKYLIITVVPLLIGLATFSINMQFIIATFVMFIISYMVYIRLDLLTEIDRSWAGVGVT